MAERHAVVVIGAGISGLTAAHRLRRSGQTDVVVVDPGQRAGGMIHTESWRGFTIEHGPEGFLSTRPEGLGLVDELGLRSDLVTDGPAPRRTFILRDGTLRPLPQGILQPTRASARNLMTSPLLGLRGRARLALEPLIRRDRGTDDQSVAAFVRRRFGTELLDELIEPLVGGVHGAGTEALSADMVLAPLRRIEREGRSIALRALRTPAPTAQGGLPPLVTLRGGMGQLVDALAASVGPALRLGRGVASLEKLDDGWRLVLTDGETVDAGAVVLATPPAATAKLVAPIDPELSDLVAAQPMSQSQIVTLVWEPGSQDELRTDDLPGTGFLVPRREGGHVAACTWVSGKWHHRAPAGGVAVRCFLRPVDGRLLDEAPAVETAQQIVTETLGLRAHPTRALHGVQRAAIPVMHVGHRLRIAQIAERVAGVGGLALAGAGLEGSGIPACIRSGTLAAESVLGSSALSRG